MTTEIFVTDDEDELRQLITFHLENTGYAVTTYPDGEACWHRLRQVDPPPALLVTDVMMPKMNGFQLLKAIRRSDELS